MKKIKIAMLCAYILTLTLEILPYGAVLNFGNPEGAPWRRTYSYFDPMLYGYANFGPFLTALLTCVLLILTVILLFKENDRLLGAIRIIGGVGILTSVLPFLYGISYITAVGVLITVMLAMAFGISFVKGY